MFNAPPGDLYLSLSSLPATMKGFPRLGRYHVGKLRVDPIDLEDVVDEEDLSQAMYNRPATA